MVNVKYLWSKVRWSIYLLIVAAVLVVVFGVDYALSVANIQPNTFWISFFAAVLSGALFIIFDIIVLQGISYEDVRKEERIEEIVRNVLKGVIHSLEFREIIRGEVKEVLIDSKMK